jgi:hypothetical protein
VQLHEVEAGARTPLGGGDELGDDGVHAGAVEGLRHLVDTLAVRAFGRADDGPVAGVQGLVDALPHELRGALGAGVAQLQADLRRRRGVDELGDAPPRGSLLVAPQAGAAGGDPALRRHAHHLRHHEAGAAERLAAEVDEVEVGGHALVGDVHVHRRDDDPVDQLQLAEPERVEHRRPRLLPTGEPGVDVGDEPRVAQPQVVVGDAAAAGEDVERELQRRLVDVAPEVLEPLQAGLGGPLRRLHHGPALGLVGGERCRHLVVLVQAGRECQRVLHGELRAGADREVGGVGGVAEQHHVVVAPPLVAHGGEADPPRVVRQHASPAEHVGEDLAHGLDGSDVGLAGGKGERLARIEARAAPHVVVHLDDERAAVLVERVAVHLHDAVLGLADVEGERLEDGVGAQPHVAAPAHVEARAEVVGVLGAHGRVQAVARDDEVVVGP